MRIFYKSGFLVAAALLFCFSLSAQNNFFTDAGENTSLTTTGKRVNFPLAYRAAVMDAQQMKDFLWSLPAEETVKYNHKQAPVIELPMPDGKMAKFYVWESSIMEPALAAKFPEIKTFAGQGIDDPYASIRMSYNPYFGFAAQILSVNTGRIFIDAYARWDINNYISYFTRNSQINEAFRCDVTEYNPQPNQAQATPCRGTTLLTYRLALACTGEYAVAVCSPNPPTVGATAAEMTVAVNRVSGVYESEVAVRMVLIGNNNLLIYLDGTSDPYTNNSGGTMLGQNQTNIDAVIGTANYDIGHVFSTGGGGVAVLGCVCRAGLKARGVTGLSNPLGDNFYIDYVAHEMGHQYGGNHTFNGITGNCSGGNRNGSTAYEVGSGTTIQAYAGICGIDNIQPHSDPFFHTLSFDEIGNYVIGGFGGSCPVSTPTGNILPVILTMDNNGANIPFGTPFTLNATASDANSDPITYCWEEWDLGPATLWDGGATSTTSPLFKSRVPKLTGARTFPDLAVILAGYPVNPPAIMGGLKGETLPQVARAIKFRLTVRDNRAGGGGVVTGGDGCQSGFTGIFQVNVIGTGPFVVTAPNGGETWQAGSTQTITWNPAGTDIAPINVANVRITLSTDGGLTYPTVLAGSTANDGSEVIALPCINSTTARVRIEAIGNIFFDISNADFSVQAGFDFNSPAPAVSGCPVPTSMSITLGTIAACGFSQPITMSASGNPAGTTVSFSPNPVAPGSNVIVTLNGTNTLAPGSYTFSVIGTATGSPVRTRSLTYVISAVANPSITTQPANQMVCVASNATFNVTAINTTGYQWQVSTGGGPFTDIPGANASSYTVTGVTAGMNGNQYRVIASAACASPVTSDAATLTVISPVTISSHPVASEICSGSSTSFTVAGNSTQPINYQWQVSTDGGLNWTNVNNGGIYSGATTATLTLTGAGTSVSTNRYRAQLSNATCPTPTSSNGALLTVRELPTIGLTAAPLTSLLPGKTTTLTATPSLSTGGIITTSWFFNSNPLTVTGNTYVVNVEHVGIYQVRIQETWPSSLVCANQSANVVIDATVSDKLFIFPSPNDGRFTVSYFNNGGNSTQRQIVIVDSKGAKVYDRKFPISGPYTLLNIDLRSASRGIYYVLVGDASGKKLAVGKVHVR